MISIRLLNRSQTIERYLNKKAQKGYSVTSIVPFALFPPLYFMAFSFEKSNHTKRKYRIDTRHVSEDDKQEYYQIFQDDGWLKLSSAINRLEPSRHIFYSDNPSKEDIFSDEESLKTRNKNEALLNLLFGMFLFCVFIFLQVVYPITTNYSDTIIGFLSYNFYLIVAISIVIVSVYRYLRNK